MGGDRRERGGYRSEARKDTYRLICEGLRKDTYRLICEGLRKDTYRLICEGLRKPMVGRSDSDDHHQ